MHQSGAKRARHLYRVIHWQSGNTDNLLSLSSPSCSLHCLTGIHSNTKTSPHRAAHIDKNSRGFRMRSSASIWSQQCGRSCMRWTSSTAGRDSRVLSSLCRPPQPFFTLASILMPWSSWSAAARRLDRGCACHDSCRCGRRCGAECSEL